MMKFGTCSGFDRRARERVPKQNRKSKPGNPRTKQTRVYEGRPFHTVSIFSATSRAHAETLPEFIQKGESVLAAGGLGAKNNDELRALDVVLETIPDSRQVEFLVCLLPFLPDGTHQSC